MNYLPWTAGTKLPKAGMALLMCLLFLIALTLLGLSASADAVLQNQLAANLKETERAKQAALTALSWAEEWLFELEGSAPEPCTASCAGVKLHPAGELIPHPEFEALTWWQTQGYEAGIDPLTGNRLEVFSSNSDSPPMWIIEVAHAIPASAGSETEAPTDARAWYRILARGSGQTDKSVSVVESTVTRTWPTAESTAVSDKGRVSWRNLR